MRSPETRSSAARSATAWLLAKEGRELLAARAWWLMLALVGPLVGVTFANAVRAFGEVSEGAGTPCGVSCAPLIGIWAPTFSAFEIAAIFLLPFVAIRLVSGDRQSGALKLEVQRHVTPILRVGVKAAILIAGWMICGLGAIVAVVLWIGYGGSVHAPELAAAAFGHVLNGGLTISLAVAIASIVDHPSTAAVITLAITIGTWIVDFAAAVRGGLWERLSAYTPAAMVGRFQHGLIEANVVLIAAVLLLAGLMVAAIWLRLGETIARRTMRTAAVLGGAAVVAMGATMVRGSRDLSEARVNSFSEADEETLARITGPLRIQVHLAVQDPRRAALERGPFAKLRRAMPGVRIGYVARTSTGLYEQSDAEYGEIHYELNGRHDVSRVITDEGVVESVFAVAEIPMTDETEPPYAGHPLATRPRGAWLLYVIWPASVGAVAFAMSRGQA